MRVSEDGARRAREGGTSRIFAPQRRCFQGCGARRGLEGERQAEADVLQSMVNMGRRLMEVIWEISQAVQPTC